MWAPAAGGGGDGGGVAVDAAAAERDAAAAAAGAGVPDVGDASCGWLLSPGRAARRIKKAGSIMVLVSKRLPVLGQGQGEWRETEEVDEMTEDCFLLWQKTKAPPPRAPLAEGGGGGGGRGAAVLV